MSDTSTFRTASAPAAADTSNAPGADPALFADEHEASLFATYEADQKRPYAADYFEVGTVWDMEDGLERDLKEIEGYVRQQVTDKKVANTTKAAKEFLREMERKAGLSRYESVPQRIQKVLAYIDFRRTVDG